MIRSHVARALLALPLVALLLVACRREPAVEPVPGDPVGAVQAQVQALRDNDLVRYSALSLPPALQARTEALWARRVAEAEPVDPEDAREYAEVMARLTAPDAEQALMRDLEPKLVKFEAEVAGQWPLMQATAGIFLNAAIQANTELTEAEKAHGTEVVDALLAWAQPALFTDRARARKAIVALSRTARELDLPTLEQARALPRPAALEKGGIALAGAKEAARAYGLDLDRSLDGATVELVASEGDTATVKVSYPFLGKTVAFEMAMRRVGDGWYGADAIAAAEADLAEAGEATAAAGATEAAAPAAETAAAGAHDAG